MIIGKANIIKYENIKGMLYDIVIDVIISFNKKIKNPIKIDINKTLKKFSFLLNWLEKPITTNPIIIKKIGFSISEI